MMIRITFFDNLLTNFYHHDMPAASETRKPGSPRGRSREDNSRGSRYVSMPARIDEKLLRTHLITQLSTNVAHLASYRRIFPQIARKGWASRIDNVMHYCKP